MQKKCALPEITCGGLKVIYLISLSRTANPASGVHNIGDIAMTATPPLPTSYVDAIRESCRELREAQNIQVSGYHHSRVSCTRTTTPSRKL